MWRCSCECYHALIASGCLQERDRVELLDGFLFTQPRISTAHCGAVSRLGHLFQARLGDAWLVRIQNPITIHEYSEPEPDVVVAKYREDFYSGRHPYPEDVLLVIEVADTSLAFDREAKVPLYASCGIQETWLVDLNAHEITAYRKPDGARYSEHAVFSNGDILPVPGVEGASIAVADLGL